MSDGGRKGTTDGVAAEAAIGADGAALAAAAVEKCRRTGMAAAAIERAIPLQLHCALAEATAYRTPPTGMRATILALCAASLFACRESMIFLAWRREREECVCVSE